MEEIVFEVNLDLNIEALHELSGDDQVAYEEVRIWGRSNHLAIRRGALSKQEIDYGRRAVWEVPLQCLVHPHPECRFRYLRLSVDFRQEMDGADLRSVRIEDLSPQKVDGKDPVRIVTKRSGDLSFEFETIGMGGTASATMSQESQVYFPVVRGSKVIAGLAVWDFEPLPGAPLYVDRELRLLVSAPTAPPGGLHAEFRVETGVRIEGLRGMVPLIGRQSIDLTARQLLN